ncbi:hypothetical protein MJO28_001245 [Puccinia striiformis f. sp. tritici]|uniref:Uncharacterized protein n=1 Tax=Puccinia striiformis f. sp. tritici TaxID=168172 RepID=A0ACC0EUI4_9BASI|nr:hypothetical protein MJO28_001245 [Puccinia striiformis f. sp. tritici]
MEDHPTPSYIFRNANIISFRTSNSPSNETLTHLHSFDEILLHKLEESFVRLKREVDSKLKTLQLKQKNGQLNESDEEWMDNEGNLVEEQLLMDRITRLKPDGDSLMIEPNHLKTIQRIQQFNGPSTPVKKKIKDKSPLKTKPPKKPSQQHNKSVKNKHNPKSSSSQKPVRATLSQKIEVLNWHQTHGSNQTKTAAHFSKVYPDIAFKQPLISAWVREEDAIREQAKTTSSDSKRIRTTKFPEIEQMLDVWVTQALHSKMTLTGDIIRAKWQEFASKSGIPSSEWLSLSDGWLTSFKSRHHLKSFKKHGEAAQAEEVDVSNERERLRELLRGYNREDIWNMDETGLMYGMPPDRGLAKEHGSGLKGNKVRITIAVTANSDGSEKLPLLIIGKYAKPRAFQKKTGGQLGFEYYNNSRAWMTSVIFEDWIIKFNLKMKNQGRKILLLVDNFAGHTLPEGGLSNIRLEFFLPNLTAHVQPMDAGIISAFKSHYKQRFISRSIQRYDQGVTITQVYKIDQLTAMHISRMAWDHVTPKTITNCWNHTQILPQNKSRDSTEAAMDVSEAQTGLEEQIGRLQSIGLIHPTNRMSVNEFLNPPEDNAVVEWTTDEIFEYQKQEAADSESDNEEPEPRAKPTVKAVFSAINLINEFIHDEDSAFANHLNHALHSYSKGLTDRLIATARQSSIRNFFRPGTSVDQEY